MKPLRNLAVLSSLIFVQACSFFSETKTQQPVSLTESNTSAIPTFVIRGEVTLGHEVRAIKPCGSQQQYWIDLPSDKFQQALTLVTQPYQPLYGELIGYLQPPTHSGFDADFRARFVVTQVNMLTAENPERCQQVVKPTRAFGNEPFWSTEFSQQALYIKPMGEAETKTKIVSSRFSPSERFYQLGNGSLTLSPLSCSDTMSDTLYGWQSELEANGKTYSGCATLSNQDATQEWSGLYLAQSTEQTGFSVRMQLNSDHTASTRYIDNSGQSETREQGYWQQLNDDQVQVVMTHHQQQYLISERLFTRDGNRLTAKKEKISGQVYTIAQQGLTLYRHDASPTANEATESATLVPSQGELNKAVDQAVRQFFIDHRLPFDNSKYRWLTYDLNGDGHKELLTELNWCGSGGCTLLVFENRDGHWTFNSRITLVRTPIEVSTEQSAGWDDLIFNVSGGGVQSTKRLVTYQGKSYPLNPSTAPAVTPKVKTKAVLFSDLVSPYQKGIELK